MTTKTWSPSPAPRAAGRAILTVLTVWAAAVSVASLSGLVSAVPIELFPLLAAAGIMAPTVAYFTSSAVRDAFDGWGQRRVLIAHAWRIPAAIAFWVAGSMQLLPPTFVRNAAWGDFFAGVLGLAVAAAWPRRAGFIAFHVFGFADFVLAVGTGFWLSVVGDPLMHNIETFPLALIPLFGVGLSGASHLASFAQLAARRERI